jgi:ATP-dependent DNA helicase RecG
VPYVKPEDLSTDAFKLFRKKALQSERLSPADLNMSDAQLLESLLLTENNYLRRAAVMLFHDDPEKWVTGAYVKIGYFENDLLYYDEVHGPLIAMPDKVVDVVFTKYFKGMISYEGIQRIETFPVPREAFREAVLNAILHKTYGASNPIQIRVYPDKVTIYNAGKLPENWTVEDMRTRRTSRPYNPLIANAFFKSGMVEAWGRGVERINESLTASNRAEVEYDYNGSDMTAVFNTAGKSEGGINGGISGGIKLELGDSAGQALAVIKAAPTTTTMALAKTLGKSEPSAAKLIDELKRKGYIIRRGSRKSGYWEVK